MDNKKHKLVMTGISLTELERDIVQSESINRGLHNFSATLRMIIREWRALTATPPGNDKNQEDE